MFVRVRKFLTRLFGGEQCSRCPAPAVGFWCEVAGKLKRTHKDGTPVTVYYLDKPAPMCAACMEGMRCR